jgi:drug/metabolite transporter (DMT)-like permease
LATDAIIEHHAATSQPETKTLALPRLSWQWAAFGAIALAACGHLLIKQGLSSAAHSAAVTGLADKISLYLFHSALPIGLAIYGIGTLLWIRAVASKNISFLYPLTALNYVIVSIGGKVFFNERISFGRWAGISIVVLGVAMLHRSAKEDQP